MIEVNLTIGSPSYYSSVLTAEIPVRVRLVGLQLPVGFAVVEALDGRPESLENYIQRLEEDDNVEEVITTYKSPTYYWTKVTHRLSPSIYETILDHGAVSLMPIILERGLQYHRVLIPSPSIIQPLLETLRSRFKMVEVTQIRSYASLGDRNQPKLTLKQEEALQLAYEAGYYMIPRLLSMKELSKLVGRKRTSFSEIIRRAESRLVQSFFANMKRHNRNLK